MHRIKYLISKYGEFAVLIIGIVVVLSPFYFSYQKDQQDIKAGRLKVIKLKKHQKYFLPKNADVRHLVSFATITHKDGTRAEIDGDKGKLYPYEDAQLYRQAEKLKKQKYVTIKQFKRLAHNCCVRNTDLSNEILKQFKNKTVVGKGGYEYRVRWLNDIYIYGGRKVYKLVHVMNPDIYKRNSQYRKVHK